MSLESSKFDFTPWNATKFFFPLCIQAMSQSLTYPLVGIVVAHGKGGAFEFSAFTQGLMIMFLLGTLGYGLVVTGMVYAKDRIGYIRFARVSNFIMLLVVAFQILLALPVIAPIVFGKLLGLQGDQLEIARWSMLCSIPAQIGFFLRNIPQVVLYNKHETAVANIATILRIIITAIVAFIFYHIGLVGWQWGCVCFTVPVLMETAVMWFFANPYVRQLPMKLIGMEKVTVSKIFFFNIPLSLGGLLLMFAIFMLNAIINRTEDGTSMLAVHLVAVGLINPLSYGAMRNQAVAIGFPQRDLADQRTLIFAFLSGICLSLTLLVILIPSVSEWYFCHIQNLLPEQEPLARHALWIALMFPVLQAVRGHAEGLAAFRRRPNAVLAGQAAFFGALIFVLIGLYHFNVSGYLMGIISLCVASAVAVITIRLGLALARLEPPEFPDVVA
ncbi:MAG: hypothetical protein RR982_02385 [Kiritimatiellia bacterium]